MKFRTIFIIFNIVLVFSFLFIFFVPFFLFNLTESLKFWMHNWPFVLFFIIIISVFNIYFIKNWKIYTCLENEQWGTLTTLLQKQIFEQQNVSKRVIRLYVNAALLSNNAEAVISLEDYLREKNKAVLKQNIIYFVVTRILLSSYDAASQLLAGIAQNYNGEYKDWILFYQGFVTIMQKDYAGAIDPLNKTITVKNPIIRLIALYLFYNLCIPVMKPDSDAMNKQNEIKNEVLKLRNQFTPKLWSIETEKVKNEIPAVIISNIIDEAGKWMYQFT